MQASYAHHQNNPLNGLSKAEEADGQSRTTVLVLLYRPACAVSMQIFWSIRKLSILVREPNQRCLPTGHLDKDLADAGLNTGRDEKNHDTGPCCVMLGIRFHFADTVHSFTHLFFTRNRLIRDANIERLFTEPVIEDLILWLQAFFKGYRFIIEWHA